jgi:pimeloyl-ACP methyl ester carboxylesterase
MMSVDAFALPRFGLPLTPPGPRVVGEWLSTYDHERWPEPPPGEGRPVMLVPGFLAGDQTLTRMAVWLRGGGFVLTRSGISWNTRCMEPTVIDLERRLERAVQETGQRALLVGQSRGGTIARALATLRPDLVGALVTLGSPLLDQLSVKPHVWAPILTVGTLGTLGVPGMFSIQCLNGDCCVRTRVAVTSPFPDDVRFMSLYSRTDEIVNWESCLDAAATQVEVDVSHLGMGFSREVWEAIADELRAIAPPPAETPAGSVVS